MSFFKKEFFVFFSKYFWIRQTFLVKTPIRWVSFLGSIVRQGLAYVHFQKFSESGKSGILYVALEHQRFVYLYVALEKEDFLGAIPVDSPFDPFPGSSHLCMSWSFFLAHIGSPPYDDHHQIIPNTQIENSLLFVNLLACPRKLVNG